MMKKIYLDYNASTPIDPVVKDEMLPLLTNLYGNPSALHWAGQPVKETLNKARNQIAKLINGSPEEIIFTSGGSEANNFALKGVYFNKNIEGKHFITSKIEHPAIINPLRFLEGLGAKVSYIDVDQYGRVLPEEIEKAITSETVLITIMHSNNEVGTLQPIKEIGGIAKKYGILFHTDASQSVGKVPVDVNELNVDMLTIAGHKLYAPKGIGALYVRKGTKLVPLIHGAGHEFGSRAGTENTLLAVGLGKACEMAMEQVHNPHVKVLTDYFWEHLRNEFGERVVLNGHPEERLPNTLNVSFINRVGQDILSSIPNLAASTGSACHAGSIELSPVLKAMKVEAYVGMGAIRFSLGRDTTKEEIDLVLQELKGKI